MDFVAFFKVSLFLLWSLPILAGNPINIFESSVWDWRFYLNANPELAAGPYSTPEEAAVHWNSTGMAMGLQAHPGFHSKQYLALYPDLQTQGITTPIQALTHYLNYGCDQGKVGYFQRSTSQVEVLRTYNRVTISDARSGESCRSDIMYVGFSNRTAGAIDSIWWNGKEFINSHDHGRQAQYAWQYGTYYDENGILQTTWGECFNPTEAGSSSDYVGPTSRSVLYSYSFRPSVAKTKSSPAYWSDFSSWNWHHQCNNITAMPQGPAYTSELSGDILKKRVKVIRKDGHHIIQVNATVQPHQDHTHLTARVETLAVYLTAELKNFCTIDLVTGQTEVFKANWTFFELDLPVIAYDDTQQYAIGMYTKQSGSIYKVKYGARINTEACSVNFEDTTKLLAVSYVSPTGAEWPEFMTYIAVGNLKMVIETLTYIFPRT